MVKFDPDVGWQVSVSIDTAPASESTEGAVHATLALGSPGSVTAVWLAGQIISGDSDAVKETFLIGFNEI